MRAVSGDLRLELSQFEEVARFALLGTEVDEATQHQLARGERLQAALRQPQYQPLSICAQVAQLYAVTSGFLDDVSVDELPDVVDGLPAFVEENQPYLYGHVNRTGEWSEELEEMLKEVLREYRAARVEG
jgi:F-type H+-transporting ATPase subunit alpha